MYRSQRIWLLALVTLVLAPAIVQASRLDDLVAALAGDNDRARSLARQLLPHEGAQAVPRVLPLLRHENTAVREAAFQVLADLANEASAPGRSADRAAVTTCLMALLETAQPAEIKMRALRLLTIVIPSDGNVGPIAALLDDKALRERARVALEEAGTAACKTALRQHLDQASLDPEFACALMNSLGRLHDADSLVLLTRLTQNGNTKVRAAAARALAWTGDPAHLETIRSVVAAADPATRSHALDANLRLLNSMERQREHRQEALAGYRALVESTRGPVQDGALAGLGRAGDASCVPVILTAIRDAAPPTLLVGMDALRALPGENVTRALTDAYPKLPARAQLALIPVLGARRHPIALPLLEQLSQSEPPATRFAALEAMGDSDLPQAMNFLSAAAKSSDTTQRAKVQEIITRHNLREVERRQRSLTSGAHDTDLLALLGIIGRWWVVGPFDLGEKNQGWETRYIGEPDVNVVARYMSGKTRRQWKRVESQDSQGRIDLRATIADRDNCIGYAYTEIELDQPIDGVLLLGVDDGEKIWVNCKSVFEQFTARPLQVDQDHVPVHLKAGTNTILLKIYQNSQGWEFCARIVNADGRPVPFKQKAE